MKNPLFATIAFVVLSGCSRSATLPIKPVHGVPYVDAWAVAEARDKRKGGDLLCDQKYTRKANTEDENFVKIDKP